MVNRKDLTRISSSASAALLATVKVSMPRTIAKHASAAANAAMTYFQTAATSDETPSPIGRPAYQKAGMERVQKDTLQATAIPAGPHGNARTNNKTVAADSTSVQRSQRPGFPMERWIQPTVLYSNMIPIPGPNNSKILPDSDHLGPSTRRTISLP